MKASKHLTGLFVLPLLLLFGQLARAQHGTGAILDKKKYARIPIVVPFSDQSYAKLPKKASLKPYCPVPGDQGNTGTCVGWAAAYGARTVIESITQGYTRSRDWKKIDENAFSPSFLYNQLLAKKSEDDCITGGSIHETLDYMRNMGCVRIADFPFEEEDCRKQPGIALKNKAYKHRIKDYQRLSFSHRDGGKVKKVRQSLANQLPVVVGLEIYINLRHELDENYIWHPHVGNTKKAGNHALLVVGYDDDRQLFEIMNSWGPGWGNGGFFYMPYNDFERLVHEAYHILYDKPTSEKPILAHKVSAKIDFRKLETEGSSIYSECLPERHGLMYPQKHAQREYVYEMLFSNPSYSAYQVFLTPGSERLVVYAFSFDPSGQVSLLYPFDAGTLSLYGDDDGASSSNPIIPFADVTVVMPHEDYCLKLDANTGTHNCFLFSEEPLEIDAILSAISIQNGNIEQRLKAVLGPRLTAANRIAYDAYQIGFEAILASREIVPVIVDMKHEK